jgi:hypothetical protein
MKPAWFPNWREDRCLIVASGPSAALQPVTSARGHCRVIAINNSWRLAPWADALYASDGEWWRAGGGDEFTGLKVSRSDHAGVRQVRLRAEPGGRWCNRILTDHAGEVGAGGSSCFQALNLAVQFGARCIALVGCDGRVDLGNHWHPDHAGELRNPHQATADLWVRSFDDAAEELGSLGVEVTNCSPVSALTKFKKASLADWLQG